MGESRRGIRPARPGGEPRAGATRGVMWSARQGGEDVPDASEVGHEGDNPHRGTPGAADREHFVEGEQQYRIDPVTTCRGNQPNVCSRRN